MADENLERKLYTEVHVREHVAPQLADTLAEAIESITARVAFNYGIQLSDEVIITAATNAVEIIKLRLTTGWPWIEE
jgi:hypothetical protein